MSDFLKHGRVFGMRHKKSRRCIGDRTSALLDGSWLMGGLNIVKLTNLDLELPGLHVVQLM
jgi:hypothetical protein